MQNIRMIGRRMFFGTRRICFADLMASQPSGSMKMFASTKMMNTA
jgi:hypothetical protein